MNLEVFSAVWYSTNLLGPGSFLVVVHSEKHLGKYLTSFGKCKT